MVLEVLAYHEGIAFRYHFLGGMYLQIKQELTEFAMPEGTQAWHTLRAQTPYQLLPLKEWPVLPTTPSATTVRTSVVCSSKATATEYPVRVPFRLRLPISWPSPWSTTALCSTCTGTTSLLIRRTNPN